MPRMIIKDFMNGDWNGNYVKVVESTTVTYHMIAMPGTAITDSQWVIFKVIKSASDSDFNNKQTERITYAGGNRAPVNIAANYDTYSYS